MMTHIDQNKWTSVRRSNRGSSFGGYGCGMWRQACAGVRDATEHKGGVFWLVCGQCLTRALTTPGAVTEVVAGTCGPTYRGLPLRNI